MSKLNPKPLKERKPSRADRDAFKSILAFTETGGAFTGDMHAFAYRFGIQLQVLRQKLAQADSEASRDELLLPFRVMKLL